MGEYHLNRLGSTDASDTRGKVAPFLVFQAKGKEHLVGRDYDPLLRENGRFLLIPEDKQVQDRLAVFYAIPRIGAMAPQLQAYRLYLAGGTILHSVEWGRQRGQLRRDVCVEYVIDMLPYAPLCLFCTLVLDPSGHYDLFLP